MKTIKTILAFLMVISMIAPAMADTGIVASAYGSARSGDHGSSAFSTAEVTVNGVLSEMSADVMSGARGHGVVSSSSYVSGYLNIWEEAEVFGTTVTSASGSRTWARAETDGSLIGELATTSVEVSSRAKGGEGSSSGATVGTYANWDIFNDGVFNPGVISYGNALASYGGACYAKARGNADVEVNPWFTYGDAGVQSGSYGNTAWVKAMAAGSLNPPEP